MSSVSALAAHLQLALSRHIAQCRRDGRAVPPELLVLEHAAEPLAALVAALVAANGRERDDQAGGVDAAPMALLEHREAAELLGVSRRTIRRRVAAGVLRVSGRRIVAADVLRLTGGPS